MRKALLAVLVASLPTVAHADPTITSQPGEGAGCAGAAIRFSIAATGTGPVEYQWQRQAAFSPRQWVNIEPVTAPGDMRTHYLTLVNEGGSTLRVSLVSLDDVALYRCLVTDETGGVFSSQALLTVLSADVGQQGGEFGSDGLTDVNDFVVFIDGFFQSMPWTDMGMQGGAAGSDDQFDNNDFVVFIDLFFNGCTQAD